MSITLTHPTAGPSGTPLALPLPSDLIWTNEFGWQQVLQTTEYTTTGALLVEAWAKQTGRPIELRGGVDYAWCQHTTLQTLQAWAAQPAQPLTLTRNGTAHTVLMDHAGGAITAEPVVPYSDPLPQDIYTLTLKFIQL